jgi:hypothetical protein
MQLLFIGKNGSKSDATTVLISSILHDTTREQDISVSGTLQKRLA